jgi:transitional endoplasmic reticulum ATPase
MPLAADVDVARLASITHGYVGADLEALAREAAMTTLRNVIPELDLANDELPYELLMSLEVDMDDFESAFAEIEPSAIREVFVEIPDVSWDDVGGLDDVKRQLREAVEWPLVHRDLLRHAGVRPVRGILLHGPPGTGKTLLVKAIASQSGVNFISVKGPALLSKYVGESERGVREVFKKARQAAPCIVFLDELDSLAPTRRAGDTEQGVEQRVMSQLLTELDGVEELKGVLVMGATNRLDMLDPALIRPGRFDLLIEVGLPDPKSRARIFEVHLANKPIVSAVDPAELADRAEGMTGADIEAVCQRATLEALRRHLVAFPDGGDQSALQVTQDDLDEALQQLGATKRCRGDARR